MQFALAQHGGCSNAWCRSRPARPKGRQCCNRPPPNSPLVTSCTAFRQEVIAAPRSGFESDSDRASAQPQQVSKKRNVKAKPSVQAKSLLYVHREPFDHEEDDVGIELSQHASEPLSPDDPLAPLPFNPYKGNRGLTRAFHAMKNSLDGFRVVIRVESAFRQART